MAYITPVHGTAQPVFHQDVANGSVAGSANVAAQSVTNPAGPKLDFFSLQANAALTSTGNTNGYLGNVLNAIQQIGTIAFYQVSPADVTVLNIGIYPTGIPTANIVAAAQTANITGTIGIPTANISTTASFTTQ